MHKIRWLALGAAAALLLNVGTVAAAPNDFDRPAEKLCTRQGGSLFDESSDFYTCNFTFTTPATDREIRAGRQLCESAYKGDFTPGATNNFYDCNNIPSN